MTIQNLKNNLNILQIAEHLGINIQKGGKANCPFHADKTPSLQFSNEKQIATCFSSNCNAGTMDVINLTEKKLNISTHEAINYLKENCMNSSILIMNEPTIPTENELSAAERIETLTKLYQTFERGFLASSPARKYVESRNLNHSILDVGYNSGTFHHSVNLKENRDETLIRFEKLGLLKKTNSGYTIFGKGCLVFPLRNKKNEIVSFYFRSITNNTKANHYYLKDRKGLFSLGLESNTRKVILTESIIDAVTIYQNIKGSSVIANYGTEGSSAQINTILELEHLQELILFFDGDTPGIKGAKKIAKTIKTKRSNLQIRIVQTPTNEDINSLLEGHNPKILKQLTQDSIPFSIQQKKENLQPKERKTQDEIRITEKTNLNTSNTNNITYTTETAQYQIKGGIRKDLDSLKVTLVIQHLETNQKSRSKLDLYEDKQTERIARESSEKIGLRTDLVERDLSQFTDLLDEYRELETPTETKEKVIVSRLNQEECLTFLRKENLLKEINNLIEKSGVVGEYNNRIFLFVIASSYKMTETLHALIQGSSGSGKTHLLNTIMEFMPPEDTISLTRVTESSFYNYGQYELQNKLIGMEDFDGLEEKAELAFRELQSKGMISSSTSGKNEQTGRIEAFVKEVYGPIASLSATTKGAIYEDNMSRSFLVAVDESKEQTLRIINYQNKRASGKIDEQKEDEIQEFLRNCIRLLHPHKVVNPFADKIELPKDAHKIRRLNDLFQSFVKQVTLLNQYNRKKDKKGRVITQKEDIKTVIDIMFESIILKVDELDGSLRDFYEKLKTYVENKGQDYEFIQREIRQDFKISKTQMHRHITQLLELEYIYKTFSGSRNTYHYKIVYWDNLQALRDRIQQDLNSQLDKL